MAHAPAVEKLTPRPIPYAPYPALLRLLDHLASGTSLRLQLNPKTWSQSAAVRSQLRRALWFLDFVTPEFQPTLELEAFIRQDEAQRRQLLKNRLASRFQWITTLPPDTSHEQFLQQLSERFDYSRGTSTKAAAFCLSAATDLGIRLPVAQAMRGRPRRSLGPQSTSPVAVIHLTVREQRGAYFAFLLDEAKRSANNGSLDRDLLDRLDRLTALSEEG